MGVGIYFELYYSLPSLSLTSLSVAIPYVLHEFHASLKNTLGIIFCYFVTKKLLLSLLIYNV